MSWYMCVLRDSSVHLYLLPLERQTFINIANDCDVFVYVLRQGNGDVGQYRWSAAVHNCRR